MSSVIYVFTMLLLETQLDGNAKILKGLELFGYFFAAIYANPWFKAHVGAEAVANDLQSYKLLTHEQIPVLRTYLMLFSQH